MNVRPTVRDTQRVSCTQAQMLSGDERDGPVRPTNLIAPLPKVQIYLTGSDSPYFELQADVGVTEHMGGLDATAELLEACHVDESDLVLDVGCGTGITTSYIADRYGCQVVGLDISDRMLDWAANRANREGVDGRVEFVVGTIDMLPFGTERFDVVVGESVTAFAEDKAGALAEYKRVTNPGGYVGVNESTWLAEPPDTLRSFMRRTTGAAFETPDGWRTLLEEAGLQTVAATPHAVRPVIQYKNEVRRQGVAGMVKAWGRAIIAFGTDPAFRRTVRQFWPRGWSLRDWGALVNVFEYYGYGIYVGQKSA